MVWVDLLKSMLALTPSIVVIAFTNVDLAWSSMWPVILVAVVGVGGAMGDVVRWAFTRYRVTEDEVERHTGVFVRRTRTLRRDRIRSADTHAKLRHRIAGLRVVTIGAGQQVGAGEAALRLDALTKSDAAALREELLSGGSAESTEVAEPTGSTAERAEPLGKARPWWAVYNMFSVWAYVMAAGMLWGAYWILASVGVDVLGALSWAWDPGSRGWWWTIVLGLVACGLLGAVGMAVRYLTANWGFELDRVRRGDKEFLRTRRGLLSTREVNRDEARRRGLTISEPLLWRWMGMADTNIVTTGLSVWDPEEPTAILPRGPVRVARRVADRVLGEPCPLDAVLEPHPRAALRRRLWWATLGVLIPIGLIAWPWTTGLLPMWLVWVAVGAWLIALGGAWIAYRALGHAISGEYLVVRSGLAARATTALRRDAVSTIVVRQSVLQRRLNLCTVSARTAAGWGVYEAPDVSTSNGIEFARLTTGGVLDDFLAEADER